MRPALDIAWALACSFLAAGFIFATAWIWLAIIAGLMGGRG